MSTCPFSRLSNVDLSGTICKLAWHSRNLIKCFHFVIEATEDQEPFWSLPMIMDIFIYLSLKLFLKIWVWESSKCQRFCPCDLSMEEKPVTLWCVFLEQFMRVWAWDSSLQLISHTLWRLNRTRYRGLFALLTPIVGKPLFREPIVVALFLEV